MALDNLECYDLKSELAHVLWLGGSTDAGKTTTSRLFAKRYKLQLYNYDRRDEPQARKLAETMPSYQAIFDGSKSVEERWLLPEPEEKVEASRQSFRDRFPLVIEELLTLPKEPLVLAEGFGLIPELLEPIVSSPHQLIFFICTEDFKWASMKRRNKPTWKDETSDPELATQKFFKRDMLLAARVKKAALERGYTVQEVDGSKTPEQMVDILEKQFHVFLNPTC